MIPCSCCCYCQALSIFPASLKSMNTARKSTWWIFHTFRWQFLTAFFQDLDELEADGLTGKEHICDLLNGRLKKIAEEAEHPSHNGFLRDVLANELFGLQEIYEQWNSHNGMADGHILRKDALSKLRRKRDQIKKKAAKGSKEFCDDKDRKQFLEIWDQLEEVTKQYPTDFPKLTKSLARARAVIST